MSTHPALNATGYVTAALLLSAVAAGTSFWAVKAWQRHQAPQQPASVATVAHAPASAPASATAPRSLDANPTLHRPAIAPERPALQASLWIDGRAAVQAGERVALPSGTSFQVRMQTARPGVVRLVTENAAGERQTIWQARLDAGESRLSPSLRLQGLRGMERLWLLTSTGSAASFHILHV